MIIKRYSICLFLFSLPLQAMDLSFEDLSSILKDKIKVYLKNNDMHIQENEKRVYHKDELLSAEVSVGRPLIVQEVASAPVCIQHNLGVLFAHNHFFVSQVKKKSAIKAYRYMPHWAVTALAVLPYPDKNIPSLAIGHVNGVVSVADFEYPFVTNFLGKVSGKVTNIYCHPYCAMLVARYLSKNKDTGLDLPCIAISTRDSYNPTETDWSDFGYIGCQHEVTDVKFVNRQCHVTFYDGTTEKWAVEGLVNHKPVLVKK